VLPSRSSTDSFLRIRSFEPPSFSLVVDYLLVQVMGNYMWTQSRRIFEYLRSVLVLCSTPGYRGFVLSLFIIQSLGR